jgi:hypothetical protein
MLWLPNYSVRNQQPSLEPTATDSPRGTEKVELPGESKSTVLLDSELITLSWTDPGATASSEPSPAEVPDTRIEFPQNNPAETSAQGNGQTALVKTPTVAPEPDGAEPRLQNGPRPLEATRSTASGVSALAGVATEPGTTGLSTRFFGLTAQNTHTVAYVIDCSGSMGAPPLKLRLAKDELIRSIESLHAEQSFSVVFFSNEIFPMPGPGVLPATDENKQRVASWVESMRPTGGTNPLPALIRTLQLQPETIYVLSDGLFKGDYVRAVRTRNREPKRSSIYTINFGDRRGERQLLRLARENGGHYRHFLSDAE